LVIFGLSQRTAGLPLPLPWMQLRMRGFRTMRAKPAPQAQSGAISLGITLPWAVFALATLADGRLSALPAPRGVRRAACGSNRMAVSHRARRVAAAIRR
jgi:hypothetical protein